LISGGRIIVAVSKNNPPGIQSGSDQFLDVQLAVLDKEFQFLFRRASAPVDVQLADATAI
jgi:hypothetical protein